ncbi:ATP-binding protein [Nonomuraea sp. CA-143628]|uniref:ATP-binding protein n=1 Tax=Nonomuraea sp. CA-143628 TaxID=3239997 RepID=UPI003D8F7130
MLRCEVEDTGTDLPAERRRGASDEHGHGLRLLKALACCWGSARTPAGKVVWFETPAAAPVEG